MLLQPVPDLVLAVGGLKRGEFHRLGFRHLLGDLLLDADHHAQGLGRDLAVGEHGELVPHAGHAVTQVGNRSRGRRGRVVQLVSQAGGDGAQRQQLLPLADDLTLPQPTDHVALEQVHSHRKLRLHESGERTRVQHEKPRRLGHPHRRLVDG